MVKHIIPIMVVILLIGVSVIPSTGNLVEQTSMTANRGDTLYVGGSGYGNYTKIRYAIENASDGDTVFVYDDSSLTMSALFWTSQYLL